jgi:3-phosphoshikimate 1-carboxyvinyltransferase
MLEHRTVNSSHNLQGDIQVPGDKSISHRALILGALANGQTNLQGFLPSKDCLNTLNALRSLGVSLVQLESCQVQIQGVGIHGLKPSAVSIDCGNSGTTMRLLAGVLAGQTFATTLSGDQSLSSRPMDRIITPLREMGATISGFPPLSIGPSGLLRGIEYAPPVASAQVKSCVILAGLYADQPTIIKENIRTRDHTERLLPVFGAGLTVNDHTIILDPSKKLHAATIEIPGDFSSAAFFIAGASMTPGSHLLVRNVGVNPTRTGLLSILTAMGADITLHPRPAMNNEPVADIEVRGTQLQGIAVPHQWVVSAIDEFPMIFVAAATAVGDTLIHGIGELRTKETDRIAMMAQGLQTLGVPLAVLPDGIMIQGIEAFEGGEIECGGDHRIAMAFAMASLKANDHIVIKNCENIATSFPNFWELAAECGLLIGE